jgi:hypothetical protein
MIIKEGQKLIALHDTNIIGELGEVLMKEI